MEAVTHREMRDRISEILRRVEAGESIQVSNNGRPTAVIIPVGGDLLDGLIARGEARPARSGPEALATIERSESAVGAKEILTDVRGELGSSS